MVPPAPECPPAKPSGNTSEGRSYRKIERRVPMLGRWAGWVRSRPPGGRCRPAKRERLQLKVEALEDRLTPATLQLIDGLLTYTAGNGFYNNLSVSVSGNTYTFKDTAERITL